MKKMRNLRVLTGITTLLSVLFFLAACGDRKESIVVKGTIDDRQEEYIKLWITEVSTPRLVDSALISKKGEFKFITTNPSAEPHFYQLGFSRSDFITLLAEPGENITIEFSDSKAREGYIVTGSEESEKIKMLDEKLQASIRAIDSLRPHYIEELDDPQYAEEAGPVEEQIAAIIDEQRTTNISFILANLNSMSSVMALYQRFHEESYVLGEQRDLQFMKLLTDSLSVRYPESKRVKAMAEDFQRELNQLRINQMIREAEQREPITIDPALPTPGGNIIQLSSLTGRYVLVTFWSALAEECHTENDLLKNLYQKYKSRGFEIYQINIDDSEEVWRKAVTFEELPWISVRDSDGMRSKYLSLYNIQRLPSGFLYDRDGEIMSGQLSGRQLTIRLDQIFGN
jgi:peroxiredoxin